MDHHCSDSDSSDESIISDHIVGARTSFSDENEPEDIIQRKMETDDKLKKSIEELKSEFDKNHQTLIGLIKDLNDTVDELESMHKNTTVGSLVGSSTGAVGGIASIAGVCLAPFTLGASLALTVAGAAVGVAGGVTGAASNITNTIKQKNLRETIEKIINDFQNTIKPMIRLLNTIYNITKEIQFLDQKLNKFAFQTARRGAADLIKIAKVANVADMGKMCAEAAKGIRVYVKAVKAVRGTAGAAKAVRGAAGAVKEVRVAAGLTGALSALFLAADVYCIVQDSIEISQMNQPTDKKKAEEITSETLKFILKMREMAAQFKSIVDTIKDTIDRLS